ncbi:DUF7127 family protein [Halorussus salinisoli]|uniref:DUF7127 family protein n=1 Tax=Halorussus salinisoli TaxID=2558242 RepID=UPI0010C1BE8D|nr:hypothetical protein [Halorussus salinisoli]
MDAPAPLQTAADEQEDITISRREYEDENVIVIDFGRGVEAHLDVIDGTAIVVAGDRQFEFEIPDEATDVTTNDGMLIIKE